MPTNKTDRRYTKIFTMVRFMLECQKILSLSFQRENIYFLREKIVTSKIKEKKQIYFLIRDPK